MALFIWKNKKVGGMKEEKVGQYLTVTQFMLIDYD